MDLTTLFTEDINPVMQLNTVVLVLKQTEVKITPISGHDIVCYEYLDDQMYLLKRSDIYTICICQRIRKWLFRHRYSTIYCVWICAYEWQPGMLFAMNKNVGCLWWCTRTMPKTLSKQTKAIVLPVNGSDTRKNGIDATNNVNWNEIVK